MKSKKIEAESQEHFFLESDDYELVVYLDNPFFCLKQDFIYLESKDDLVVCLGNEAPEERVAAVKALQTVVLVVLYWRF